MADNEDLTTPSFAVYSLDTDTVTRYDPDSISRTDASSWSRGEAERLTEQLYEQRGFNVGNNRHKESSMIRHGLGINDYHQSRGYPPNITTGGREQLRDMIRRHTSTAGYDSPLDVIDEYGIPDLIVQHEEAPQDIRFVEVKVQDEELRPTQREWINRFDFFDIRIAVVFSSSSSRDAFIADHDAADLLSGGTASSDTETRPELSASEIATRVQKLTSGNELLFNDRTTPLQVVETGVVSSGAGADFTGVKVRSVQGNEYVLSQEGDWYRGGWYRRSLWWVKRIDK